MSDVDLSSRATIGIHRSRRFAPSCCRRAARACFRIACAAFAVLALARTAAADRIVIDFEDVELGTSQRQALTDRYAARGITFNNVSVIRYANGVAHGQQAIEQCWGVEFCTSPFVLSFPTPVSEVKVRVGYSNGLSQAAPVVMEAFGAGGERLGTAQIELPVSQGPQPVARELAIASAGIARVTIANATPNGLMSGFVLDDVEFVTPAPDLAVAQVSSSRTASGEGWIDIRVENRGDANSSPADVLVRPAQAPHVTGSVPSLSPGQGADLHLAVGVPPDQSSTIEVTIDPSNALPDRDRSNNSQSVQLSAQPIAAQPANPPDRGPQPPVNRSSPMWPWWIAVVAGVTIVALVIRNALKNNVSNNAPNVLARWHGALDVGTQAVAEVNPGSRMSFTLALVLDDGVQELLVKNAGADTHD